MYFIILPFLSLTTKLVDWVSLILSYSLKIRSLIV